MFSFFRFTKSNVDPTTGLNHPQFDDTHLTVGARPVFNMMDFQSILNENIQILSDKLDIWSRNGSGWTVLDLRGLHLNLYRFNPINGSGGMTDLPIPKVLSHIFFLLFQFDNTIIFKKGTTEKRHFTQH